MTLMKAAVLHAKKDLRIEDVPRPSPREDEVLIQVKANGICASDVHFYFDGHLGAFAVDRPYIPGHECSGVVAEVGRNVSRLKPGDRVVIEPGIPCRRCRFCKSGHYNLCRDVVFLSAPPVNGTLAEYVAAAEDFVFPMPHGLSFEQGALVEPLAVAMHATGRGGVGAGKRVAVIGSGPIGLLSLQASLARGATEVMVVDMLDERLAVARQLSAGCTVNPQKDDAQARSREFFGEPGVDVVIETAGVYPAYRMALELADHCGVVVLVAWPVRTGPEPDLGLIVSKELDVRGVFRYANVFPLALKALRYGKVRLERLITHRFSLDETEKAIHLVQNRTDGVIKAVVLTDGG